MGQSSVTSPDGHHWKVRRRWLDRPLPDVRRRFREYREETDRGDNALDAFAAVDIADNVWVGVVMGVALVLIAFLLLPVLGVALELIALFVVLSSGVVGRIVLRRPWTVEAVNLDDGECSLAFAVKGWRRSGQAVAELTTTIAAAGPPERIALGVKV